MLTLVALLAVVGIGGYLFLFQRDFLTGLFKKGAREAKGLVGSGPAKTAEEAVEKFKDFVKKRDYETAAQYLGGLYGEMMKKSAKAAEELGKAADSVRSLAEKRGITLTDKARAILDSVETFPTDISVLELKPEGDDKAQGKLNVQGRPQLVEVKRDAEGWKVHFRVPNEAVLRLAVDRLNQKGKDYARALERIHDQIMSKEIQTKDELENKLATDLAEAGR
jgi:hypothetical protein